MNSFSRWVAIAAVLLVGGSVAIASRNSSGTYSLPAGNPVVSGSTITSTWANSTLTDLATGVTDSLDRYGRGAMLAPLKATDGSETAPGITFSGQSNTGIYRAGSGDVRVTAAGADVVQWDNTGETVAGDLFVSGDATVTSIACTDGITVTRSTANSDGLTATGSGTGAGAVFTGGSGGSGVVGHGTGVGKSGGVFIGGSAGGAGVQAMGNGGYVGLSSSSDTGIGATLIGGGTSEGLNVSGGTAATGAVRRDAVRVTNGDISLDGVTVPTSTTAIKNRLTPSNIIKAWGTINCTSSGCSVVSAFNVAGVSVSGDNVQINLAQNVTSGAVTVSLESGTNVSAVRASLSAGDVSAGFYSGTTHVNVSSLATVTTFDFIATGVQ